MAQKKITDLTLRSSVTDGVNIPGDDGIQTYRVTAAQIWDYIYAKIVARPSTITGAGTVITSAMKIVFLDPTSAGFTQDLPAVAGCSGWKITFKNIATNGNIATLDAASTELIDNALTLDLGSDQTMDSATVYCDGTKWYIL